MSTLPGHARVFRAATQQQALMLAAIAAAALLLALLLIWRGASDGVTFAAFLSYSLAALLTGAALLAGYWAAALNGLRYEIAGGALTIVWGLTRQVVPLSEMERLVRGRALGMPRVHGIGFPGWPVAVGQARLPRLGQVLLSAAPRTPAELLYLVTTHETYGISPMDQQGLIAALQQAMATPELPHRRQEVLREGIAGWPVWADRNALLIALAGLILALAAMAVVFAAYTGIPDRTVLPFPEEDRIGGKRALLGIPLVAAAVVALNTLTGLAMHRVLRPVAYLLLLGGIFVETLLLVAAIAAT